MKIKNNILVLLLLFSIVSNSQNIVNFDFETSNNGFTINSKEIGFEKNCGLWIGDSESLSSLEYKFQHESRFLGFNMESGCGIYSPKWFTAEKKIEISFELNNITISFDYIFFNDKLNWAPSNHEPVLNVFFEKANGMGIYYYKKLSINNNWENVNISLGEISGDGKISAGTYKLRFILSYSAIGIDDIKINKGIVLSNDNYIKKNKTVYPNPAQNKIFVNGHYDTFQIYNSSGCVLYNTNESKQEFDISFLKPGIYYVKQINGSHSIVTKLIKL